MCPRIVLFRFAGSFVLISLLLSRLHHPAWLAFTAFVGFNLLQSSFTGFCPLERMLAARRAFGCRPVGVDL
ncbi:MAG: DUF2892 domain-containing protein [Gemmatimonadaceae bacterium]|nr:DUF2892 domain-containing protein [Gemmatimonadaceae bacterium]